jgi:formylglycine-generating enzyme required for sulfatase activity
VALVLAVGLAAAWIANQAARDQALSANQAVREASDRAQLASQLARDEALQAARAQHSQAAQQAPVVQGLTSTSPMTEAARAAGFAGVAGALQRSRDPQRPFKVQIVVHRSGKGPADFKAALLLLNALPGAQFERLGNIEPIDQTVCGDVRVYHASDLEAASKAVSLLNLALKAGGDLRQLALNDRRNEGTTGNVRPGRLEVWLPPLSDAPIQRNDRWGESRLVAAGCAVLGSDAKDRDSLRRGLGAADVPWFASELPVQRVFVPAYYIGRTEVTAAKFLEYQRACEAERGASCPPWKPKYLDPQREGQRPAAFVSWAQANSYCRWAGGQLPTDWQWEKAARGIDGRFWPWGDEPLAERFQGKTQQPKRPVAVASHADGDSPYGVADMAGNLWEFTRDVWAPDQGHSIRGGSYLNTLMESRTSVRWASSLENEGTEYLGFRCVVELPP